jgi:succinate-acetate transporter protein
LGCGLIELKDGHLLGGNVFFFFSAFFMLVGGLEFLVRASATYAAAKPDASIDGWAWLVLLVTLILWTPCYMKTSSTVMGWALIILTIGVAFVVFRDLGIMPAAQASPLAGWFLLITGCLGIYQAAGMQLNAAFGRTILPLGGPMIK